jgi:hypothetical protein
MTRKALMCSVLVGLACVALTGCMPKMTIQEMKDQMPKRPAELDQLDAFVGKWQFEGDAHMDMIKDRESLKSSGTGEYKWSDDRWFLVGTGVMSMEEFDDMYSIETWTYDPKAKKYRSTWVGSMGMVGIGDGKYDEDTNTWHMKGTGYGPGGKTTSKGWMKFTDPDTMEWWWAEYYGLMKTMEMTGTGKRIK